MSNTTSSLKHDHQDQSQQQIAPKYTDLIIGLVYYAGAMGGNFIAELQHKISKHGYKGTELIKISDIIEVNNEGKVPVVGKVPDKKGCEKLNRVKSLQDLGDEMRSKGTDNFSNLASHAIKKIKELRDADPSDNNKKLFIIDSLKHRGEVELLREVYGNNFRLIAIHCSRKNRLTKLKENKFRGANEKDIISFMERDEKDKEAPHGQEVRNVFYLADFFIDHNDDKTYSPDLERFVKICVANEMVRPNIQETGMYHAQASALRSSCLSRQVGAAILSLDGRVLATGTNEVPKSGGGVYADGDEIDNRCFNWTDWRSNGNGSDRKTAYCHSSRLRHEIEGRVVKWLNDEIIPKLSEEVTKSLSGSNSLYESEEKEKIESVIKKFFEEKKVFNEMPGVKDVMEYSRSIHAEMDALMCALRTGTPTTGAVLYTSTFPCHNCARHIVAAGISEVYYLEPFVKSLATELHSDSLIHDPSQDEIGKKIGIHCFTGIGPRLYTEFFKKEGEWKEATGEFSPPEMPDLRRATKLDKLIDIEDRAAEQAI